MSNGQCFAGTVEMFLNQTIICLASKQGSAELRAHTAAEGSKQRRRLHCFGAIQEQLPSLWPVLEGGWDSQGWKWGGDWKIEGGGWGVGRGEGEQERWGPGRLGATR